MSKKTMSVMEMGRLLGLKKTDSYYVANKGWFKIILVGGKRRIMIDSFEEWYRNQSHYKKRPEVNDCGNDDGKDQPAESGSRCPESDVPAAEGI